MVSEDEYNWMGNEWEKGYRIMIWRRRKQWRFKGVREGDSRRITFCGTQCVVLIKAKRSPISIYPLLGHDHSSLFPFNCDFSSREGNTTGNSQVKMITNGRAGISSKLIVKRTAVQAIRVKQSAWSSLLNGTRHITSKQVASRISGLCDWSSRSRFRR